MIENIIGKGTWIDKVANNIILREKKLNRNLDMIRVESGLGASGIPHIGSMGDAVRAYGIGLSLKYQGYNSELIAYSDDMDGLRKIPSGFPSWLQDHIAKPVSNIPDPFGHCHSSYGSHMSSLLLDGLDKTDIKYIFKSAREVYKSGILIDAIDQILTKSEYLGHKISEFVGQDKFLNVLPYFPICKECGKLYVAHAKEYLTAEKKVLYECSGSKIGHREIKGCGYKGEAHIGKDEGKLAWKVEFAARWKILDIRFEAYGKDIMDSVKINDWVCEEILKFPHPLHIKYEMFLDKGGKKISKSAGNVLTPQMWMKYGTPQSILLLLFKRITGTRHIGIDDIPSLMDEYDLYEDIYFGKIKESNQSKLVKLRGIYEYINHLNPPTKSYYHIPYRLIVQQTSLFEGKERIDKVFERLKKYGLVQEKTRDMLKKIELASNWTDDILVNEDKYDLTLDKKYNQALSELVSHLKVYKEQEYDAMSNYIQTLIYETSKKYEIQPKDFFRLLYRILINSDRGPKLGNYLVDLGINRACEIIEKYL
ncbi:MAG TPA: lysine--tRNA ligase [Nitrososphaeraceae archaeon]|nr:lysine--tRNA ligase [Nitrososphaeraceae archaeon]